MTSVRVHAQAGGAREKKAGRWFPVDEVRSAKALNKMLWTEPDAGGVKQELSAVVAAIRDAHKTGAKIRVNGDELDVSCPNGRTASSLRDKLTEALERPARRQR